MSEGVDRDFEHVFVGLGANLGDRAGHLRRAVRHLVRDGDLRLVAVSPVYRTRAHTLDPQERQRDYFNAVAHLRTQLAPDALLARLQEAEHAAGRKRARRWAPRALDLDLLVHGDRRVETDELTIPHPRLAERRFVLQPLADLAPDLCVPAPFDATVADLLRRCPDADRPLRLALRL